MFSVTYQPTNVVYTVLVVNYDPLAKCFVYLLADQLTGEMNTETEQQMNLHYRAVVKSDYQDSLEFGTPARKGAIKVYHNSLDKEGFDKKLQNMIDLRNKAQPEGDTKT